MLIRRYTLQIHIAGIFFSVVSVLSILLIVLSYQNSKALNQELAQERTRQNAEQVKLAFQKLTLPVLTAIDSLAVSEYGRQLHASNDKQWLSTINAVMENNPDVLSIYVGYPSEESAFVRSTKPAFMRDQFSTPDNSHIIVDINNNNGLQVRSYYDEKLNFIAIDTDNITYKPTTRPWYKVAPENGAIHITDPYFYFFIQRMGITLSRQLPDNDGVIAADITLASLSSFLNSLADSEETQLMLLDDSRKIFAHTGFLPDASSGRSQKEHLQALAASPLNHLYNTNDWQKTSINVEHGGETWMLSLARITFGGERGLWLAKAIPEKQLIGSAIDATNNQIVISFLGLILGTAMVLVASARIAIPLKKLGEDTKRIRQFDFSTVSKVKSNVVEVKELSESISMMSDTISGFLDTLHRVSHSSNFDSLLTDIVLHCQQTTDANYVLMWTNSANDRNALELTAQYPSTTCGSDIHLEKLLSTSTRIQKDISDQNFVSFAPKVVEQDNGNLPSTLHHAWLLRLNNRDGDCIGYVMVGFNRPVSAKQEEKLPFIRQFLGFASLIKENWDRVVAQKHLFKSFIEMMASAIDTKSPYTGGHCQRVPELTFMLADAVNKDTAYFPGFSLNDQSREALYFAAWLHDCGKVTTPEYVVDKATKLETIYNRIHEVRTRFEVLKRDKEIQYWKKRAEGMPQQELDVWLKKELEALDDDFAFVAKSNVGAEFMDEQSITRLETIALRTWHRTIDDTLGLSWEEESRRKQMPSRALPCKEQVLSDDLYHHIPWLSQQKETFENWEFSLAIPELQYNRGELYNLSIQRGTLTEEERFIINDHIIQTINMLKKLPYPKHLERVPEIAGGHHEKLDGKGYPYGLDDTNLSIDARIMSVADIFEALTASDRPYKKAKTLSEALKILAFMAKDKHIDPKLYKIFIEKKVYLRYAEAFLPASQRDSVDEAALLAIIKPAQKTQPKTVSEA